ncbi:MAG: hypothetical protein WCL00_03190 [Bacteroidota bacterium]
MRITGERVIIYTPTFEQLIAYAIPYKGFAVRYSGLSPVGFKHTTGIKLSDVKQRLISMGGSMEKYVENLASNKKDPTILTKLLALKVVYYPNNSIISNKESTFEYLLCENGKRLQTKKAWNP